MPKKQKVKKPKAPRKARAIATTSKGKIGPKDKSVKQNVNVNVTSSGGGGSGGSSIPSAQPYYNPMVNAMKQGEREGENIQLKKLTDLLTKSIAPKAPAPEALKPTIRPLFEGEEVNVNYEVKRKPDLENKTLLERVNTKNVDDIEAIVNNDDVNDEAQLINNNKLVVENDEVSKSVDDDIPIFEENPYDPENFYSIVPKIVKQYKPLLNQVIAQTNDYYNEIGIDEPLLYDDANKRHFKIIDGIVVPWSSVASRGPKKDETKKTVWSHYSAKPNEIDAIGNDTIINYGRAPNTYQINLLEEYKLEQEAKANLKTAKAKKGKKQTEIEV